MIDTEDIKKMALFALATLVFFIFATAQAQVSGNSAWKTEHNWGDKTGSTDNPEETYRDLYSQCIQNDVTANIFTAPDSPLYGTKVVCSTAAEGAYIYCSHQYHLPFAMPVSKQTNGQYLITNETPVSGESENQRLRNLLEKVLYSGNGNRDHASTTTISRDTYPVSITRDYVKPGQVLLYYYFSKDGRAPDGRPITDHTHILTGVSDTGVPTFLSATSSEKAQVLSENIEILDPPYSSPPPSTPEDGIREWRHYQYNFQTGQYSLVPLKEEPGSKEYVEANGEVYVDQFNRLLFPHDDWANTISKKIGFYQESDKEKIANLTKSVCEAAQQRETAVDEGVAVAKRTNQCASSSQWENYSTVARDQRIWSLFKKIDAVINRWHDDPDSLAAARKERDRQFIGCSFLSINDQLHNSYNLPKAKFTLDWVRYVFKNRLISADPTDGNLSRRWGITDDMDLSKKPIPKTLDRFKSDEDWGDEYDSNCVVSYNSCPIDSALAEKHIKKNTSCPDINHPLIHPVETITPALQAPPAPPVYRAAPTIVPNPQPVYRAPPPATVPVAPAKTTSPVEPSGERLI